MKISASIYSNKNTPLEETISDLANHNVDMFHVDCNDNIDVFKDIKIIRDLSSIPVDLHLITNKLDRYFDLLRENPVDYLTIQYEDVEGEINIPHDIKGEKGLAITSNTDISVFENYKDSFDYILIMATTPGQSGGKFNTDNFSKIRKFIDRYPNKKVHVDGGVNGEVSFILRNLGVYSSVSGSFLFNSKTIGSALINLKINEVDSHFMIKDFMRSKNESPIINYSNFSFKNVLQTIEDGKLGFCIITDDNGKLKGISSNADIRKGLLSHFETIDSIRFEDLVNENPITINEESTVGEMLSLIKSKSFPIMYLPVINNNNEVTGVLTFLNLIKGEL